MSNYSNALMLHSGVAVLLGRVQQRHSSAQLTPRRIASISHANIISNHCIYVSGRKRPLVHCAEAPPSPAATASTPPAAAVEAVRSKWTSWWSGGCGTASSSAAAATDSASNFNPPSSKSPTSSYDTTHRRQSTTSNDATTPPPASHSRARAMVFSGNANPKLAADIARHMGTTLGGCSLSRFADGEVQIKFNESLRGQDVYIVQPTSTPVNEHLMELLLMVATCRRSSAKRISAVIPYYGYARQDRKLSSRVPISAADVATMLEAVGVDRVISVDLHSGQIQGFFGPRVPVDNLEAQVVGLDYLAGKSLVRPVVVSPDAGGVYRAKNFQEGLAVRGYRDCGLAMLIKQRARPNEIHRMDLVGSVRGCDAIIVDDMIDTAGTLVESAKQLQKHGAKRVFAFSTHGLFNGPAFDRLEASPLEEVIVTDSINPAPRALKSEKIKILSIAGLLGDVIRRIHQRESLSQMFRDDVEPKKQPSKVGG